jgi:uncharacterized protein involved in exopolysaccharide biosynthesis
MISVAAIIGAASTFVIPSTYVSTIALLPTSQPQGLAGMGFGQVAGLASSLGVNLGATSVALAYPDILRSRELRDRILDTSFEFGGSTRTLEGILESSGKSADVKRARALAKLAKRTRVSVDKLSGVIGIAVHMPNAALAQDVGSSYVKELMAIESELKSTTAKANREFVEARLLDTQTRLQVAENRIKEFRSSNVNLGNDPQLLLDAMRLERDLRIQEEVFLTLTRQLELARIEENHNEAGIKVIDPPKRPLTRHSPVLLKNVILAVFFGGLGSVLIVLAQAGLWQRLVLADSIDRS